MPIGPKDLTSNRSELLHRNVHPQFILDNNRRRHILRNVLKIPQFLTYLFDVLRGLT